MTPAVFAELIKKDVVEANVATYKMVLSSTVPDSATDAYWKAVLSLFARLDQQQREVLVAVMRQVAIDTCANLLGVVENVNSLEGAERAFELRYQGNVISGDLQDLFLELCE